MIEISIIIPTYNSEDYLAMTLNSILEQNFKEWECIIVDDGSTDTTLEIVSAYIKKDKRFILLCRDMENKKKGGNVCRNIGLNYSKADYVIFLDSDDIIQANCLKQRVDFFKSNKEYDFFISQTRLFKIEPGDSSYKFICNSSNLNDLICLFVMHKIQWTTTSLTWKKEFLKKIGGWNEGYSRLQDIELNIRSLMSDPKIKFIDQVDSYYRASEFTNLKSNNRLDSFNKLLLDYYWRLITNGYGDESEEKIKMAFDNLIITIIRLYTRRGGSNRKWKRSFLETLKFIGCEHGDLNYIASILKLGS